MKPIDVIIISPGLLEPGTCRGGGCEVTDYNVALQLSKKFNVTILGPYFPKYINNTRVNDNFYIKYIRIPALKNYPPKTRYGYLFITLFLFFIYSFIITIKLITLLSKNPRVLIVHNPQTALLLSLLAKIKGIKIIYAEGNLNPWYDTHISSHKEKLLQFIWRNIYLCLCRLMCNMANGIRAQSKSIKEGMVSNGVASNKIVVIPAGMSTITNFNINTSINKNTVLNIGFIGRLTEEKNAHLLIEICKKAADDIPNAYFYIFGEGPFKKNLSGLPNVRHIGFVNRDELFKRLSNLHAILFFQKELGRAEIECMAAGKVIIAPNMGEVPLIIQHLRNGILCEPICDSYIHALNLLNENLFLLEDLSHEAINTVIEHYTWDKIGDLWIDLIEQVLNNKIR